MAIIRWEPAREIGSLQSLFETFFDTQAGNGATARRWVPAIDVVEDGEDYVKVELDEYVLTISGERKSEHEERRDGYRRIERASGSFSRSLTLPEGVDAERIDARFENGVLEVRVPKPEQRKPRRVAIGVGAKPAAITAQERAEEGSGS
jgi:HSP20 family protein